MGRLFGTDNQGSLDFITRLGEGVERVKTALREDPLQFTPLSMRETVVPAARTVGKGLGLEQPAEDIGYLLRGMLGITPFQRPGTKIEATTPTTQRQKTAERIGRTVYGTAMTLPIGGVAAIPGRLAAGATLGAGISGVGKTIGTLTGEQRLPTGTELLESLGGGAVRGVENSWILAFTQLGLDKALGLAASKFPAVAKFTSSAVGEPFKALRNAPPELKGQLFGEGAKRLFGRAVLETLPENTAFTFLDKIADREPRKFFDAWINNLPGALVGNLAYAAGQTAIGGTYNWKFNDIQAAKEALRKTLTRFDIEEVPLGLQAKPKGGTKAVLEAQERLNRLNEAQQKGDWETAQKITDEIRAEGGEPQITGRPQHQLEIEQAINKGDIETARKLVDALPDTDPYKKSMQSLPSLQEANPVNKIIKALEEAKPIRKGQEALYSKERATRAGEIADIQAEMGGEAGYYQELGALKGELPKVEFTGVRNQLTEGDITSLFNQIKSSDLMPFQKTTAQTGLAKLLQPEGGTVPTKSEITLLNEVFPKEFVEAVLNNRPKMQVYMDNVAEVINVPRAIMASVDVSAPLRQGWLLWPRRFLTNPKQALGEIGDMFKYFINDKNYKAGMDEIDARPHRQLYDEMGLQITRVDNPVLTGREEVFMSNLAQKIPVIGRLVRASDRAYTGFLNQLRADVADSLINDAQTQGRELTPDLLASIGKFVNSASGRGDLGSLAQHATLLNSVFFSPRLMASRLNALNPKYYASLDPLVRGEAVKSLVTSVGSAITALSLAALGGAKVTADPRNADWGKIRVGDTRIDVTGGFGPYFRLVAQLLSGKIVSSTTGREIVLNEDTYNAITRGDILARAVQSKESPILAFATGLLTGKDGIGDKFRVGPEVIEMFTPLFLQDVFEAIREHGAGGVLLALPGALGAGVQTYGKKIPVKETTPTGRPTVRYREQPGLGESILNLVTGKSVSEFTPQEQERMWEKEFEKRQVDAIETAVKEGKMTREEGRRRINEIRRGTTTSPLEGIFPWLFSGQTQQPTGTVNRQPTGTGGRLFGR